MIGETTTGALLRVALALFVTSLAFWVAIDSVTTLTQLGMVDFQPSQCTERLLRAWGNIAGGLGR